MFQIKLIDFFLFINYCLILSKCKNKKVGLFLQDNLELKVIEIRIGVALLVIIPVSESLLTPLYL